MNEEYNTSNEPHNNKEEEIIDNKFNLSPLEDYEILPDSFPAYDISFKLIIVGNSNVGKSCMALSATKKVFKENSLTTIGFESLTFIVKTKGKVIKMQIWDTCGQEIYRSLITNFYRSSAMAIVVYAIDDKKSFEDVKTWVNQIRLHGHPEVKIILVGNKVDLEDKRKVSTKEGQEMMANYGFEGFLEVSAKTNFNSRELLLSAVNILMQDFQNQHSESIDISIGNLPLDNVPKKKNIRHSHDCC